MQQPRVYRNASPARVAGSLAVLFAVAALLLPTGTHARRQTLFSASAQTKSGDGRPRRVSSTPTTTSAPQTQSTSAPGQTQPPSQARPQQTQPQTPAPVASPTPPLLQQQGQEVDDDETVRVDTSLINLQVRVIDRNNRPIGDVRKNEVHVFEDGVPQTVEFFGTEEVPIQYALVVDNSGSMRSQLPKVIEAGKTIVNSNKPGDEALLVRFVSNDKIETVQDFTPNQNDLIDALETLYTEGGQTAVLDAVFVTAERIAQYKKGNALSDRRRRALILVTDGEDRDSFYKQEQLFNSLRENDVQIYVIGFTGELDKEGSFIRKSPRDKATALINRLAKETGGRAFFPASLSELPDIAREITRDLRTQYVVSYNPTNKAHDGTFRSVKVTVDDAAGKEKRIALTRSGYTAARGGGAPASTAPSTSAPPARTERSTSVRRP